MSKVHLNPQTSKPAYVALSRFRQILMAELRKGIRYTFIYGLLSVITHLALRLNKPRQKQHH